MIHNRGTASAKDAVKKESKKKSDESSEEDILLQGSLYGSESIVKK
jgi:hypothetical protein